MDTWHVSISSNEPSLHAKRSVAYNQCQSHKESTRDRLSVARDIQLVTYIIMLCIEDLPLNLSLVMKKLYKYRNIAECWDGDKRHSTQEGNHERNPPVRKGYQSTSTATDPKSSYNKLFVLESPPACIVA